MKTWLNKLRISNALDEHKPLPPDVVQALEQSPELRHFAEQAASVGANLKGTRPAPAAPVSLHDSIMRAVRSAPAADTLKRQAFWPRLVPVSALGVLMAMMLLGTVHHSPPKSVPSTLSTEAPSLALASSTLETSGQLLRTAPSVAVSPLSDEMLRLNHDLTKAQDYLLASLP